MGFISKLFSPSIPSLQQPITGKELLDKTESEEPDSPVMGNDSKNTRRNGVSSLLVSSENLYKGGV